MIDPGRLRERITIQQPAETRNAIGESVQTWSTFATRWASVDGLSSREFLLQGQQQTEITHRVRLRYVPGMTSRMRIVWRGRVLEVTSLLEHRNRSEHEALCVEDVGATFVIPPSPPSVVQPLIVTTEDGDPLVTEDSLSLVTES
jgi:SPP1 family predicted phage head-tail adaptor